MRVIWIPKESALSVARNLIDFQALILMENYAINVITSQAHKSQCLEQQMNHHQDQDSLVVCNER